MSDIRDIIGRFNSGNLMAELAGPPHYDCGRVIIRGDANGFRLLAGILNTMADAVTHTDHPASQHGWHVALSPHDLPQLEMDNSILVLDCNP